MNIWITGFNLSIDTVIEITTKDKYQRLHGRQWKSVGSKGANVFRSLIKLGVCPHLVGFTWGKTGQFINSILHNICPNPYHIHTFHIKKEDSRINVITLKDGSETLISASSPSVDKNAINFLISISKQIQSKDVLIITGSFPKNLGIKDVLPLTKHIPQDHIFIDLKGKYLIDAYHYFPKAIFKVNHIESHDLTTQGLFPDKLIVTSAMRTVAHINGKHIIINIPTTTPLNTIGAGDVFMASLVFEKMINHKNWEESLQYAAARATASIKTLGVSEWDEEETNGLIKLIKVYHP